MNKQEFLNMEAKTAGDKIAKAILSTYSKTSMKELQRALRGVNRTLYTDADKKVPLNEVTAAVEKAIFLEE